MSGFRQGSVTIGGSNPNVPNNLILSALSSPAGHRSPKDQRDAGADATSRALLLLALSALSEPSDDRCQFVLAKNLGPTASYGPGKKFSSPFFLFTLRSFYSSFALNNYYNELLPNWLKFIIINIHIYTILHLNFHNAENMQLKYTTQYNNLY